jgi:RNA polymerase sigma-B factor
MSFGAIAPVLRVAGAQRNVVSGQNEMTVVPTARLSLAEDMAYVEENGDAVARLHATYARTRDRQVRDELLAHYDGFAIGLAWHFRSWREDRDDLVQVARVGLIHAVERFDPERERPFVVFARMTIIGALKRHIRDHAWRVRVSRTLQEHFLVVMQTADDLTQELGRAPQMGEIAARSGLTEGQVLDALEVNGCLAVVSVDEPVPGSPSLDVPTEDTAFRHVENEQTVERIVKVLPERARQVLRLRFEEELTQSQIAARLGVSQMSISRELARSFRRLRLCLEHPCAGPRPKVA